ncbi:pentapeptide repeat-containing protein [Streptomyces sp. NPDC093149]|uniref:pentapeptide repeat-containing protein n=1 Tax=Streptomyces sp. NPDC093149 TaxID=3366031 RepID=UPI0038191983
MTDYERAEHAGRLRGLLYLACPDAPALAIESTAEAIIRHSKETPSEPVPEAADLSQPREHPSGAGQLNLRHAILTGAILTGADLTGADLTDANLRRAGLSFADLTRADLTGADLSGADLSGANLSFADLTAANLTGANLSFANLTGANLRRAGLSFANLTEADLTGAMLTGARGMRLPVRAIWDLETMWPANLASDVAEHSDEVSPGVYQVRGGGGKSPASSAVGI